MKEFLIKYLIDNLSFLYPYVLLTITLLLVVLDSFPPFIFIIPLFLILFLFFYLNVFNNGLFNLFFLILFPFFSLLGDVLYIKYYSDNKLINFIEKGLVLKKDKFNKHKFYFFILARFNGLFKLLYFRQFKNKLTSKVYIYLFISSFIQIFVVYTAVYFTKLIGKTFKIKYVDYLFLIISLLISFYVFNIEEEKIIGLRK